MQPSAAAAMTLEDMKGSGGHAPDGRAVEGRWNDDTSSTRCSGYHGVGRGGGQVQTRGLQDCNHARE